MTYELRPSIMVVSQMPAPTPAIPMFFDKLEFKLIIIRILIRNSKRITFKEKLKRNYWSNTFSD
jgi:hypothetical protein